MKEILKSLCIFLLTIVLVAAGAELYYRFFNKEVLGNTGSLSYQRWGQQTIKVNSWGFRDQERQLKKADPSVYRILLIGPSHVFGQGVSNVEERLSERLQKILTEKYPGRKFEVINMGTMTLDNVSTAFQLVNMANQSGMEYDSVVLYYAWNAIKHIPEISQRYAEFKKSQYQRNNPADAWLAKNSYAYDWLSNVMKDKNHTLDGKSYHDWHMDFYKQPAFYDLHIRVLKAFDTLVSSKGAKMVLLITPNNPNENIRKQYQGLVDQFKSDLDINGIIYADATNIYNGIPEMEIPVSKYDGHNKPKFYGDMAEILYTTYAEKHLIQ